jgi:hypothetical protein
MKLPKLFKSQSRGMNLYSISQSGLAQLFPFVRHTPRRQLQPGAGWLLQQGVRQPLSAEIGGPDQQTIPKRYFHVSNGEVGVLSLHG